MGWPSRFDSLLTGLSPLSGDPPVGASLLIVGAAIQRRC
jgi:hypothetical protein